MCFSGIPPPSEAAFYSFALPLRGSACFRSLILKDLRQEAVDAASPYRPVVSARISLANHVEALALKELVIAVKCAEVLAVLGPLV